MPPPSSREKEQPPTKAQSQSRLMKALPWIGGGALGVAGISEGLRAAFLPGNARQNLSDFASNMRMKEVLKPNLDLPEDMRQMQNLVDYSILGNKAMQTRPFGIDPVSWIKGFRKLVGPDWKEEESPLHYRAFQAGTLPAMTRLLEELSWGGDWGKIKPPEMPDEFRHKIAKSVRELAGPEYLKGVEGRNNYWFHKPLQPDSIPAAGQVLIARQLPAQLKKNLTPEEWDTFTKGHKGVSETLFDGYSKFVHSLQNLDRNWGNASKVAAGLGVAGLGGWGWLKWQERQREKAQQARLARQTPQRPMRKRASAEEINPIAAGALGAIPGVGGSWSTAYTNAQAGPERTSVGRTLKDALLTDLLGQVGGGLLGAGVGYGLGYGLGPVVGHKLIDPEMRHSAGKFGAAVTGLAGSMLGGGLMAYRRARLRKEPEAVLLPEEQTPAKQRALRAALLAGFYPVAASSTRFADTPGLRGGGVALRGLGSAVANSVLPFAGGALAHHVMHGDSSLV